MIAHTSNIFYKKIKVSPLHFMFPSGFTAICIVRVSYLHFLGRFIVLFPLHLNLNPFHGIPVSSFPRHQITCLFLSNTIHIF